MHREQFPCKSKVELSISCFDLVNKDVASKSDPTCVVFIKDRNKHWTEVNVNFFLLDQGCATFGSQQKII